MTQKLAFSSWNINMQAISDKAAFYTHLARLQPGWLIGMNGLAELMGLRSILPNTQFIHRWKVKPPAGGTHPDDDDNPTAYTPQQWLDRREANLREVGLNPGDVWLYANNESGHKDAVLRWLQDVIKLAIRRGHKLVVYNGSVGTPGPDPIVEWSKPEAIKLLELCVKYRDNVILGTHQYGAGFVASTFDGLPTGINPANGERVHADYTNSANWPGKDEAATKSMWHIGRHRFINKVMPGVRHGITEYAQSDRINSGGFDTWLNTLPVAQGFKEIRGPMTAAEWWKQVFPDLSTEEAAALQDGYVEEVLCADSGIEFIARFSETTSKDWVEGGFAYGVRTDRWNPATYYKMVEDYAKTGMLKGRTWVISDTAPTPPPAETPEPPIVGIPPEPSTPTIIFTPEQIRVLSESLEAINNVLLQVLANSPV